MSIFEIFNEPLDSRLYVDLIYRSTSQYAMFNPASQLSLGDYGRLNNTTGAFTPEGNVFKTFPHLRETMGEPKETPESHRIVFRSRAYGYSRDLDVDASVSGLVDCSLKAGWEFERDRHAALVMVDPVLVEIPYEGGLYDFLIKQESFKRKAIVTKVYKCTSYANLLTTGKKGKAYFGFHASAPIPVAVPLNAGGGASASWEVHGDSGMWSTGLYDPGLYRYTPLATLRSIHKTKWATGFRGHPETFIKRRVTALPEQYPPWGELDEAGEDLDADDPDSEHSYVSTEEEVDEEEEADKDGDSVDKVGEKLGGLKVQE